MFNLFESSRLVHARNGGAAILRSIQWSKPCGDKCRERLCAPLRKLWKDITRDERSTARAGNLCLFKLKTISSCGNQISTGTSHDCMPWSCRLFFPWMEHWKLADNARDDATYHRNTAVTTKISSLLLKRGEVGGWMPALQVTGCRQTPTG
jgi:hypothetical protein